MAYDKSSGISFLAETITGRIKKEAEQPIFMEFGTIDENYNLQTDTFPELIPKTDYLVCRSLMIGEEGKELSKIEGGKHSGHTGGEGNHSHVIPIPETLRKLMPNDRVLVLWLEAEAVVVDIVLSAEEL